MNERRILIKSIDGGIFSFILKNDDLISDIKMKISDKIALNVEEQILCYQGEILEDMRELNYYEIINYSIIDVVGRLRGGMQIFIKLMDGTKNELKIDEKMKVKDLKLKVQEKIKMYPAEQILVYRGMVLDDDEKILTEYQIQTTSVINIVPKLRIQISVEMDNKKVKIDVQKFDEIIDLKKKIQMKFGLHPDEQKLIYEGRELDDDKTINEYQICDQSDIIVVSIQRIHISLKRKDGRIVEMKVQKSLNIIDLKNKIEEKLGLSINKQKLIYQGVILNDDNKSIDEYQICEKSVINIVAKITIFIIRCKETMITIEIYETDRIKDLKKIIQDKLQLKLNKHVLVYQDEILDDDDKTINQYQICDQSVICLRPNEIEISVKLRDDKIFIINALISSKIIDLKRIIKNQSKIQPDEQILIFKNEILNDDDKTIDEYQIYDQSLIHLETKLKIIEKQIFVKTNDGKTIEIKMNQFDKIIDLKHMIEKQTSLQPNEQILIYEDRLLNADDKTMDEYQIGDQSVINVVVRISIFVSIGNKITIVEIYKTDKIRDLKHKIQDKFGFNTDKHKLFFLDKILNDDDKTIDEYEICDQSTIYLRSNTIEISITMAHNVNIAIQAQLLDKIVDIKKKIECQTLLTFNDQVLFYHGEKLADNKTVDDYQMCDQSVIHLKYRIGLFIKTIDGKTITCQVKKSNTIIDLKRKIQRKIELHWYEQILVFKGAMLENSKRIDQYEICDKSVITIVARLRYDELLINVKKVEGRPVWIEVKKSLKIIDLKAKIEQRTGLQPAQQILLYDEKILNDDEKIIDEYEICNLAVIYVSCRNEWSE